MKHLSLFIAALAWAGAVSAQHNEYMVIEHQNGSQRTTFDVSSVKRVTFETDENNQAPGVDQLADDLCHAYGDASYGWFCELLSDNVIDMHAPHLPYSPYAEQTYTSNTATVPFDENDVALFNFDYAGVTTDGDTPAEFWESTYTAINTANKVIARIHAIDADYQQQYGTTDSFLGLDDNTVLGEAYLCRAYSHFILSCVFSPAWRDASLSQGDAGVPCLTEPVDELPTASSPRPSLVQTYDQIEQDLLTGLRLLAGFGYSRQPKFHFTPESAHAFAARFYLFRRDYAQVIAHANAVLGTDRSQLPRKLADYSRFRGLTSLAQGALLWQAAQDNNNLLLVDTYSLQFRRSIGSYGRRYVMAGLAQRDMFYHTCPLWPRYTVVPAAIVGGLFGSSDNGYVWGKVAETFEYTDRMAGIGYCHLVRTEFTASELLLERAEAHLLSGNASECLADLAAYEASRQSFADGDRNFDKSTMVPLSQDIIDTYFSWGDRSNCFSNWNFTTRLSPSFVVTDAQTGYMNCISDMRRFETAFTGRRFFDLKRWGIEYTHVAGADATLLTLTWDDSRRAVTPPDAASLARGRQAAAPAVHRNVAH